MLKREEAEKIEVRESPVRKRGLKKKRRYIKQKRKRDIV
jgi:hypothetical protein